MAVEEGCIAADFADGVAHAAEEPGVFIDEVTGAVATADLLVGEDEQQHVAGGVKPCARARRQAAIIMATPPFMSRVPRPQTQPSAMAPLKGGCVQCWPTVVTTSTWP